MSIYEALSGLSQEPLLAPALHADVDDAVSDALARATASATVKDGRGQPMSALALALAAAVVVVAKPPASEVPGTGRAKRGLD